MLVRDMNWVLRWGELSADVSSKASYAYVGGSPIFINSSGKVTGNLGATAQAQETSFCGIAWHNIDYDDANGDLASIVFPPGIFKIYKGTEKQETTGTEFPDAVAPWKTGVTYTVGNLLRPTVTTGTPAYAVWTNEAYNSEQANVVYPYPAKLIALEGTGASPTSMQILIGVFYKES